MSIVTASACERREPLLQLGLSDHPVSRAYYAAFHYARALLLLEGLEPKTHRGSSRCFWSGTNGRSVWTLVSVGPMLYLGFLITAIGAAMVLYYKPQS